MKLTILGSGSPEAYARRASSGYLIEVGEACVLFDCGGGVVDNLLRSGRQPSQITHIVFSHLHSDHMMDYARLVHAAWDEGGDPIKVFGPAPIGKITQGYFGPNGVLSNDLRARTELPQSQQVWLARGGTLPRPWPAPIIREIGRGEIISGDGWEIMTSLAPHAQPILECLAFSLTSNGKKFVYSGDAGLCDDVETLAQDADLLLHWCYRVDGEKVSPEMAEMTPSPSEIGALAKRVGAGSLLLTHFRKHMDDQKNYDGAIKKASAAFGKPVRIAEDLQQFDI